MYFHIDESGNTGNNLFDPQQPRLSYGILSSLTNADVLCASIHRQILRRIGSDRIHASVLGVGGLTDIAPYLAQMQVKMRFDFDYYFIDKPAYALVAFFEAVFDAGLNAAVKWEVYWTPMRYLLIHKLTVLFDEELLRRSWQLCTVRKVQRSEAEIIDFLSEVRRRVISSSLDRRTVEIIVDALDFGIARPLDLDFGSPDHLLVSPNAVGFQFVVAAIARHMRKKRLKNASSIIVDRQTQFNGVQIQTHQVLGRLAKGIREAPPDQRRHYLSHPLFATMDKDDVVNKDLPERAVTVSDGTASIGLQVVDVYLWLANRILDKKELSPELFRLWGLYAKRSLIDGISFAGMEKRFLQFEELLPKFEDLTSEQLAKAQASVDRHRAKVKGMGL